MVLGTGVSIEGTSEVLTADPAEAEAGSVEIVLIKTGWDFFAVDCPVVPTDKLSVLRDAGRNTSQPAK